ncbi:hypothetical protein HU200_048647 [Digitaria exilis]|uniref:RING-type domain-containing protein n=1 Tax=Digitaria exilis TaxID=1010633 RepID=A0A835AV46_9POAL|nr:hypothetical protein HU200_048647 [Digitaria exilis]
MHCDAAAAAAAMELEQMQCPPHDDQRHHRWPAEHGLPPDRRRRASSGRPGRGRRLLQGGAPVSLAPDSWQRRRRDQEAAPASTERPPDLAEGAPAASMAASEEAPASGDAGAEAEAASASPASEASSASLVLCAVCLEELRRRGRGGGEARTTTLPCSHSYHPGCVMPWLAAHGDCPCCRAAVPSPENHRH